MILPGRTPAERAALARARARLHRLDYHPRPVRMGPARVRRFAGYELGLLILLRHPLADTSDDLIAHEPYTPAESSPGRLRPAVGCRHSTGNRLAWKALLECPSKGR